MKYVKKGAKESQDERDSLERLYSRQLHEADPEAIYTVIRLQRFYRLEDAAIRFRAKVETAESERLHTSSLPESNQMSSTATLATLLQISKELEPLPKLRQ
jgi:hypothetical protein